MLRTGGPALTKLIWIDVIPMTPVAPKITLSCTTFDPRSAGALGVLLFVTVGCAALRVANELRNGSLFSLTLGLLLSPPQGEIGIS